MKVGRVVLGVFCLMAIALAISSARGSKSVSGPGSRSEPVKFVMAPERWTITGEAEFVQLDGRAVLQLNGGNYAEHKRTGEATLKDFTFQNGTIEYDVKPVSSMGAGIGFRRRDKDTFEEFYLRPRPNCAEAVDCIQYAPETHGVLLWDMFPQYQSPAPLREGEWNHIKLVVSGRRMNIFINGAKKPTLAIGRLEGDAQEGGLLLQGPGLFSNLSVTPNAVEGLPGEPEPDAAADDRHYVRNWQLSPYSALAPGKEPEARELPPPAAAWVPFGAERNGVVNVTREYGLPLARPERAVAWLKSTIFSDTAQRKRVKFGWSREAWFFVNGQLVYADKNLYQPPTARKTPDGRLSLDNGSFDLPLKPGANEIAVAVANNFYGWGLILRFEDVDGLHFADR